MIEEQVQRDWREPSAASSTNSSGSSSPDSRRSALSARLLSLTDCSAWLCRIALVWAFLVFLEVIPLVWPTVLISAALCVLAAGVEVYRLVLLIEYWDVCLSAVWNWIRRPSREYLLKKGTVSE